MEESCGWLCSCQSKQSERERERAGTKGKSTRGSIRGLTAVNGRQGARWRQRVEGKAENGREVRPRGTATPVRPHAGNADTTEHTGVTSAAPGGPGHRRGPITWHRGDQIHTGQPNSTAPTFNPDNVRA